MSATPVKHAPPLYTRATCLLGWRHTLFAQEGPRLFLWSQRKNEWPFLSPKCPGLQAQLYSFRFPAHDQGFSLLAAPGNFRG